MSVAAVVAAVCVVCEEIQCIKMLAAAGEEEDIEQSRVSVTVCEPHGSQDGEEEMKRV